MSARRDVAARRVAQRLAARCRHAARACSWFTDFKQQPKIDPWETRERTRFRSAAIRRARCRSTAARRRASMYDRTPTPQNVDSMANIPNPIAGRLGVAQPRTHQFPDQLRRLSWRAGHGRRAGDEVRHVSAGRSARARRPADAAHRRLHLRHDPQRPRPDADVQPHRRAGSLGRRQLCAHAAGQGRTIAADTSHWPSRARPGDMRAGRDAHRARRARRRTTTGRRTRRPGSPPARRLPGAACAGATSTTRSCRPTIDEEAGAAAVSLHPDAQFRRASEVVAASSREIPKSLKTHVLALAGRSAR